MKGELFKSQWQTEAGALCHGEEEKPHVLLFPIAYAQVLLSYRDSLVGLCGLAARHQLSAISIRGTIQRSTSSQNEIVLRTIFVCGKTPRWHRRYVCKSLMTQQFPQSFQGALPWFLTVSQAQVAGRIGRQVYGEESCFLAQRSFAERRSPGS